jgi:hypothetical protein
MTHLKERYCTVRDRAPLIFLLIITGIYKTEGVPPNHLWVYTIAGIASIITAACTHTTEKN